MSTLTLSLATTKRYFGFGNSNDYVVLKSGRMIGRIMLIREDRRAIHGSGRSLRWSSALGLNKGYSATREQAMADFKARWLAQTP